MTVMRTRQAVIEALSDEMESDPNVFLMGEDVGRYGGCFAVSKGLLEEFGDQRIAVAVAHITVGIGSGSAAVAGG